MSTLDELPPDQRAALSLLLAQRKSYSDVAQLLHIGERAVHDRAHAALAVLAPAKARELTAEQRELVGDYMLGQHGVAAQLRTRTLLSSTPPARAWALALETALAPLASDGLPEIPAEEAPPSPPAPSAPSAPVPPAAPAEPPAPDPTVLRTATAAQEPEPESETATGADAEFPGADGRLPSSRIGGAIVLAVLLAAIVVGVVLLTGGGSGSSHAGSTASKKAVASGSGPSVSRIEMRPAEGGSQSLGLLQLLQEGSKRAFYLVAEKMPSTSGFFYALWLYNSPSSSEPLGKAPAVGSNHRLEGGGSLPADAGDFHEVLLTRETSIHASHPGTVVLRGKFSLAGESTTGDAATGTTAG